MFETIVDEDAAVFPAHMNGSNSMDTTDLDPSNGSMDAAELQSMLANTNEGGVFDTMRATERVVERIAAASL